MKRMGFQVSSSDPAPPPPLQLRVNGRKTFQLVAGFAYQPAVGPAITVPAHPNEYAADTDLASVPSPLWGLLASYGRQLRAALMHDHQCAVVNDRVRKDKKDWKGAAADRRRADDLFREAMRDPGDGSPEAVAKRVGWFRSWMFWAGVSFGRYAKFFKLLFVLLVIQVLAGIYSLYVAVGLPIPRFLGMERISYLAVFGVLLLLSALWGRDWRLPFIGLIVGPLVLPVLVVTLIAQFILGLPDLVKYRLDRQNEPPPDFGSTITRT